MIALTFVCIALLLVAHASERQERRTALQGSRVVLGHEKRR